MQTTFFSLFLGGRERLRNHSSREWQLLPMSSILLWYSDSLEAWDMSACRSQDFPVPVPWGSLVLCGFVNSSGRSKPSSVLLESLTSSAWSKTGRRKQTVIVKCLPKPSLISPPSIRFHGCLCSTTRGSYVTSTWGIICSLSVFSHKSISSTNKSYLLGMLARLLEILQGVPDTWDISGQICKDMKE